jgi:histidyl-tRNA synthetase
VKNVPEFQTVRGMRDFLAKEAATMKYIEALTRELARLYGFQEIVTPVMESFELLSAKSGEEIRQRMYMFTDLGGRKVALRPEFTASIARVMASTLRNEPKPLRLYCFGSLYRYDEPQFGRYREFWQSNYELMGTSRPEADVEILALTNDLFRRIGLSNCRYKIGHVGIVRGILSAEGVKDEDQSRIMQLLDKKQWDNALSVAKESRVSARCLDTLENLFKIKGDDSEKVLMEIENTVSEYEQAVTATQNFREILELLRKSSIGLDMSIEADFARGLEYYTGIIFEVTVPELDVSIAGGGRYDKLIGLFGGEPTPAVGIAHGIDRIMLAMQKQNIAPGRTDRRVIVVPIGEDMRDKAQKIASSLRDAGVPAELEVMGRSVARALQDADRKGVTLALILGPKEMERQEVTLRDMEKREQRTIRRENLLEEIRQP